ncbi:MAG TPA: esterase [Candidatus Omnitrophica bacterium]|nr:esterase [Candidatus Omnitrophota bacterium]HBG64313.1 esterase [Candidatus Omnitrophota bacterium]HCD37362.1 esterase [Candidatus Omnitrophota bacterium]
MRVFNNPLRLSCLASLTIIALLLMWQFSYAGSIRERVIKHRSAEQEENIEDGESFGRVSLPSGVRLLRDVPYGKDRRQCMDIYMPQEAAGAPVIFMVHGGAWRLGDKGSKAVVENKVARWVSKGFIFISINYRLLPNTAPLEQAEDVACALAIAQDKVSSQGGDPTKFILMGHSAGAHLVALLASSPAMALKIGARPWLGTVLLDSAALDVVKLMEEKHSRFYDRAFGSDPAYWRASSPFHALSETATPIVAVCSTRRSNSCPQASRFVTKATSLNARARVLEQDLSHKDINQQLGTEGSYTDAVESFMGTLDESVLQALTNHSSK